MESAAHAMAVTLCDLCLRTLKIHGLQQLAADLQSVGVIFAGFSSMRPCAVEVG
jgi:hypothetical protein